MSIGLAIESLAYQQWFEKAGDRDNARRQRLLEANGTLPALQLIEEEATQLHDPLAVPCDAVGRPR